MGTERDVNSLQKELMELLVLMDPSQLDSITRTETKGLFQKAQNIADEMTINEMDSNKQADAELGKRTVCSEAMENPPHYNIVVSTVS